MTPGSGKPVKSSFRGGDGLGSRQPIPAEDGVVANRAIPAIAAGVRGHLGYSHFAGL